MSQPQWITPAGSLGVIPENTFYSVSVEAEAADQDVFFRVIAGELPDGIQVTTNGVVEGTPVARARVQGVPQEVSRDVTSKFAIRAYTTRVVNGVIVIDRLADRTFSLTITGQDIPDFLTPPGNVGTFYDGTEVTVPIRFTDSDPDQDVRVRLLNGQLPPGLVLDPRTGVISGVIIPLTNPGEGALAGYDRTGYDAFAFDFSTRSASRNFQFTLELTDGVDSNLRTFEIFVYSRDSMTADTTDFTADNTFITADVSPVRVPILLTPEGDLGRVRADNFYAFKFEAVDFDGDPIIYSITVGPNIGFDNQPYDQGGFDRGAFSLPPGLTIDPNTGWFYGYIPDQGATEQTYTFAVQVYKQNNPTVISGFYFFTITIIGQIDTEVTWLTPPDLGTVLNGAISTLFVAATNRGGKALQYRLDPGSDSKLPQGLTLQPSGNITGRVSFNTFALDGGTTTFDVNARTREGIGETTFDLTYRFTVNAFASESEQLGFEIGSFVITNGGSGYTSAPTVTISAPPPTSNAIQATAGAVTISGGQIVAIALGNPGRGYTSPPTVTITGGGGSGATVIASMVESELTNAVSVFRRFTIRVDRYFEEPYQSLYVKCMPPADDRDIINDLIQNQDLIPSDLVYRADDPNFGVAKNVIYAHAYGLNVADIQDYVAALDINHYWKNVTLGEIKTARALDSNGNVLYEVVYSEIIDDLVNAAGESVSKAVTLPFPVDVGNQEVTTVYPNSLINMRDQVIDTVGQIPPPLNPVLPLWMTTKQANGSVLGFTPAWVIAYVKPGESGRVAYNIRTRFTGDLNAIDFKIDRYEIDRSMTWQWNPNSDQWDPQPPAATTFDQNTISSTLVSWENNSSQTVLWENVDGEVLFWLTPGSGIPQTGTVFDGGATRFITPTVRWVNTDAFDAYLLFPRINILQ